MALTSTQQNLIVKTVVGVFDAAPGAVYLNLLAPYADNQAGLVAALVGTDAFKAIYPDFYSNDQFATKFLDALVGSTVNATDKANVAAYAAALLNGGASRANVVLALINALDTTTNTTWAPAAQAFHNQVTVASYYSINQLGSATSITTLQSVTAGVTNTTDVSTNAAIEAAIATSGSAAGQTFTLTTTIDNVQGTTGNDIIIGDNTGTVATVTAADVVNGGNGTDTFNYYVATAGGAIVLPNLSAVENINLIGTTTAAVTANTSAITGVQNLNLKNSTKDGSSLTVANGVTIGYDNVVTTATTETANFAAAATSGSVNLLNGASLFALSATGAGLTGLSINSTGSAANTVTTLTTTANTASLTLTGDKALKITNALNNAVITVDASTDTGGVTVKLGTPAAAKTVTVNGGTGADKLDLSGVTAADVVKVTSGAGNDTIVAGANLATWTAGTAINGGDGTDIINITNGGNLTATTAAFLSNIETLDVSGAAASTYDTSLYAFSNFQADASIGGAVAGVATFSNVASTGFAFSEIAAKGTDVTNTGVTVSLKTAASGTDSATLNLTATDGNNDATANGQVTDSAVTLSTATASVETVTINSSVNGIDTGLKATSYTNVITALVDAAGSGTGDKGLTTLNITGNANLTITTALAATTTANLTKVDASASTGNVTLDVSSAAKTVTYLGSAGVDTVTFGVAAAANAGASIYGGAGNDAYTLGTGTALAGHTTGDSLVYKSGSDTTQTLDTSGTKISATSTLETVTNFQSVADAKASHDTIDLTNFALSGVQKGVAQLGTIATVNGGTFAATSSTLFTDAGGARGIAVGNDGTNTFIFVDADKSGTFDATKDIVIKLAGVHGIAVADFAL